MDREALRERWKQEEDAAHIQGWDFSHIRGRYEEEKDLPWSYRDKVLGRLTPETRLLDIDTGGGEFLLSLGHPYDRTAATEGYPPNVELCRRRLLPLGIDFREMADCARMPFGEGQFDLVLNRHGDFCASELRRVLKSGGLFLTQQVGEDNDRDLVEQLLPGTPKPFPGCNLREQRARLEQAGLTVLEAEECYRPIRFFDVGALVWFAHVIEWEFPGFTVDSCLDRLLEMQRMLEERGAIEGTIHRYLLAARKP